MALPIFVLEIISLPSQAKEARYSLVLLKMTTQPKFSSSHTAHGNLATGHIPYRRKA